MDIDAAHNPSESVRRLLLRNRFASQLFQISSLHALLAVGLAADHERTSTTLELIVAFVSGGASMALQSLRANGPSTSDSLDLTQALPRLGAALWAHDGVEAPPPPP